MSTKDIITKYYQLANSGDWKSWVDLFASEQVMDEQLAGHVEGKRTLRKMMADFPKMYKTFQNVPYYIVIEGEEAAVFSHINATTPAGESVDVDAANYFHVTDGQIIYMCNVHDTVPFKAVLAQ